MELTPKYLTFTEYRGMGGTLDEGAFLLLEYKAENIIDTYTNKRLRTLEDIPNELKLCVFDLIPQISEDNTNILSERIGNYQITRKDRVEQNKSVRSTVMMYLSNVDVDKTPALYCGLDEN